MSSHSYLSETAHLRRIYLSERPTRTSKAALTTARAITLDWRPLQSPFANGSEWAGSTDSLVVGRDCRWPRPVQITSDERKAETGDI